jgi:hypothetical protein
MMMLEGKRDQLGKMAFYRMVARKGGLVMERQGG